MMRKNKTLSCEENILGEVAICEMWVTRQVTVIHVLTQQSLSRIGSGQQSRKTARHFTGVWEW